jgi:DNA-binding CsgD family transcriptional regulator
MNNINTHIEHCIEQYKQIASNENIHDLDAIKYISNKCSNSILIRDITTHKICYANDAAVNYFNLVKSEVEQVGFSFHEKLLHPEYNHLKVSIVDFYNKIENYNKTFEYIYYVKTYKGWSWAYCHCRVFSFFKNGKPKYLVGAFGDVADEILTNKNTAKDMQNGQINNELYSIQYERYHALNDREKEILYLVSQEHPSLEIAEKLNLSKASVDVCRKILLKKLDVKNGIGLAKYALFFHGK